MASYIGTFSIAVVVAWLTAHLTLIRSYQERWWVKKYEAYEAIINSLYSISSEIKRLNADILVVVDTGMADLRAHATQSQVKYDEARNEIRRMADIGEFVISPYAVSELRLLVNKPLREWEKAVDVCHDRVRECAKNELNPRMAAEARRIANRVWQFLKSYR